MIEPFFNYIKNLGYTNDNLNKVKILLEKVSKITKYTKEEILEKCDYIIVDTKKEKLESILAELRSVIFLNTISFKNIEILKRHKKKKNVDILASLSNDKFDIEVTCFTKEHSRKKNEKQNYYIFDDDRFIKKFNSKIEDKLTQLKEGESKFKMLIFVFNQYPEKALYTKNDYKKIIKNLYILQKLEKKYFIGFIDGENDFVYPSLSKIKKMFAKKPTTS